MSENIKERIENALDEIRPFLQKDGGDISLIEIQKNTVKVKLEGACSTCTINQMTLKSGVEMTIKKHAPLFRYLISYAWIKFYFEECIKKSFVRTEDDFIFDINTT